MSSHLDFSNLVGGMTYSLSRILYFRSISHICTGVLYLLVLVHSVPGVERF